MHCSKIILVPYYHVQYCRKIVIDQKVTFPVFKLGTLYPISKKLAKQAYRGILNLGQTGTYILKLANLGGTGD